MSICGGIFAYYVASLRWDRSTNPEWQRSRNLIFSVIASLAVVGTFVTGLRVAGMPAEQRRMEADHRRVNDLRNIAGAINIWHDRANINKTIPSLPPTLEDLRDRRFVQRITDPETGATYEYQVKSAATYELCATFLGDEVTEQAQPGRRSSFWNHGSGRACFALDATRSAPF
jgi:hypothetical protein